MLLYRFEQVNEYRNDYQSVLLYHVDGHHQHLSLKITRDILSYSSKASVDKNVFIKGDVNIILELSEKHIDTQVSMNEV